MYWKRLGLLCTAIVAISCGKEKAGTLKEGFSLLDSSKSNIDFSNNIIENDTLNYFNFPYLYLGGGVSVGDINNDGLADIYFTGNLVANKLYLNKGNLVFEDISEAAGVSGDDRWYTGSTMADVNNDGFLDIYVGVSEVRGNGSNQLFINNGDGTFTEEAEKYGIADASTSIQSTFFDYDNDGFLDLFVANYPLVPVSKGNWFYYDLMNLNRHVDSGHLYKNNGDGTFSDVTDVAGVRNFGLTLGLTASDFNNDGYKDLYLSNDFNVPDYLYLNNGDGTFSEVSQKVTQHTSMFGMGMDAADFNNDGLIDILQVDMTAEDYKRAKTNMASMSPETFYEAVDIGFHYQYMQNSLQVNHGIAPNGLPAFGDVSRFTGMATTDWSWGSVFADLDNDGWKDVFISNGVKRDVNNNDVNLRLDSATFWGREENPDFELMPSTPISNYAYNNNGDFTFTKVSKDWGLDKEGFSNGFAFADLDNDGDLDLVLNNLDGEASLYINKMQNPQSHYLRVKLNGPEQNPFAIGSKVTLRHKGTQQVQELTLTRGYQSSTEPILHFGTGDVLVFDELEVEWPDGKSSIFKEVKTDRVLEVTYMDSPKKNVETFPNDFPVYRDFTDTTGLDFKHQENGYDDFALEPLLPHRTSVYGPGMAVGDVNNDGLDDFYVGNAKGHEGMLHLQNKDGTFSMLDGPWQEDANFEDTGAIFFDADSDGDLELYIVSGGNDNRPRQGQYQDRLYLNTPQGFVKLDNALPMMETSGQAIEVFDFDGDGDLDIFVGGRIVPGKYPNPPRSYLLRNDSKSGEVKFTDVTQEIAPELMEIGMVTSAIWEDFDQDGQVDLILAGEWMSIQYFKNDQGSFKLVTEDNGLSDLRGWWFGLAKADVDQDGDMDFIAGNLGLNYKYKTSEAEPFEIYANDFDENGTQDIVLSYRKGKKYLPVRGRECSSQQVPAIKIRFETYEAFADATLEDIYGERMLQESLHYKADTFAHFWFENQGDGTFKKHQLPNEAQFSAINAIHVFDYDGDEYPDLLLGGNLYHAEVETPRADAHVGLVLKGTNSGKFEVIPMNESGIMVPGEIRGIQGIRLGDGTHGFLFARNNLPLKLMGRAKHPMGLALSKN